MYTLMIVEDELLARLALKNSIEWEKYNITDIIEARDGMEALEKFREKQPDIIIMDINIPIRNGIEVIKEIRKEDKNSKIIILSCLEDFEYAKEAIKAGVSQYILKASMSIEEIEAAIKTVIEELNNREMEPLYRKKQNREEEYKQKSVLLRRILSGESIKEEDEKWIPYPYLLAIFQVEFVTEKENDLSQELLNKMNFVKNVISSTIQAEYPCQTILLPEGNYVAFIEWKEKRESIYWEQLGQILENTIHLIQKYTSARVVAGVSNCAEGSENMYEAFLAAKRRVEYHIFDDSVLFMGKDEELFINLNKQWEEQITNAEEQMKILGITDVMKSGMQYPQFCTNYLMDVQNYWMELVNRVAFHVEKKRNCSITEIVFDFSKKMRMAGTLKKCAELFFNFLSKAEAYQEKQTIYSRVVQDAIAFAEENYDRPITLTDAADKIPVSPNYLSLVFHRECGLNFTDYVIRLRLDKAKLLLKTTNWKLFEIAEKCGFNDHTYFTKTFKKHEGISPYDYRKKDRNP